MGSSDISRATSQLGVAPTTYVCPKIAGSVATGVVFLGVVVLMLIPSPDHSQPVIDTSSIATISEPESEPPATGPDLHTEPAIVALNEKNTPSVPEPATPPTPESSPSEPVSPPVDQPPAEEPAPESAPAEEPPAEEPPPPSKEPIKRDNVVEVFDGAPGYVKSGAEFSFRNTEGKKFQTILIGVSPAPTGVNRLKALAQIRSLLGEEAQLQAVKQEGKAWVGWVYSNGTEVNEAMIDSGWAWYDPTSVQDDGLFQAQERARAAGRGMWEDPNAESPFKAELEALQANASPADAAPSENTPAETPVETGTAEESSSATSAEETTAEPEPQPETPKDEPATATPKKVEVDQSSPQALIATFQAALSQNDIATAQGLITSRPFGYARRFRDGELTESAIESIRATFDGAVIRDIRQLRNTLNVLMRTAAGDDIQVLVYQDGTTWKIHSWELPR